MKPGIVAQIFNPALGGRGKCFFANLKASLVSTVTSKPARARSWRSVPQCNEGCIWQTHSQDQDFFLIASILCISLTYFHYLFVHWRTFWLFTFPSYYPKWRKTGSNPTIIRNQTGLYTIPTSFQYSVQITMQ